MPVKLADFVVVDTEGRRELREIAVIDNAGKLIYRAFNYEYCDSIAQRLLGKLL